MKHYVYFLWNLDEDVLLYIGLSINPEVRWKDFMYRESLSAVLDVREEHDTFEAGAAAEQAAIVANNWPPFNKRLVSPRGGLDQVTSPETRRKLSAVHLGRKRPPETGQRISAALRGRQHSEEHRLNNSLAHRGLPSSRKGKPPTPKQLALYESMKGKPTPMKGKPKGSKNKQPVSAETRQKLSASLKGRPSPLKGKSRTRTEEA
jgi:hypothetical protein